MTEPAVSGYTIALGVVTLTGTFLGMQADALLAGLFGGFVALRYAGPLTRLQLASSLASAAMLAGTFSPLAHAAAINYAAWLASAGDAVRLACAMAIGVGAQTLVPLFLRRLGRSAAKLDQPGGGS